jgi:hypothetical protein
MPMGGFSGSVPEPTLARVRQLVAAGQLRFFLLDGGGAILGGGRTGSTAATTAAWVKSSCAAVPVQDYGAASSLGLGGTGSLYACGTNSGAHG